MDKSSDMIGDFFSMVLKIVVFLAVVTGLYMIVYTVALNTSGGSAAANGLIVVVPIALGIAIVYLMYHSEVKKHE